MKKTLKNLLLVVLSISMLFVLTGCGKKGKENNTDKKENKVAENETKEFSIGNWNGDVYTNEFLGLKFRLPDGWNHLSDEEIAEMMNLGKELLNDDQKAAYEVSKLTNVYYVVANDPSTGNSITISSEKTAMDLTEEYYINQIKTQLDALESVKYEVGEVQLETISGRQFTTLQTTVSGYDIVQKYFVCKQGNYFINIIATSTEGEEAIADMMKSFE